MIHDIHQVHLNEALDGISNTDNNSSWGEGDAIASWAIGDDLTSCFSQDGQVYCKNSANIISVNQYIFQFHRAE
jgi:hypothetical protein